MGFNIKTKDARKTVKKKSIKTKALDINSTRRLAKFGKKQKRGHEGTVISFITRKRALKKLQLSLKDFRRLCILKGIYPRQPRKKDVGKTCYHVKDIAFLAHEPLLNKFWELKSYMKKVRRLYFRKDKKGASEMLDRKPIYTVDHLVRERYPRFQDSLADLDDALSLLHLYANLPKVSFAGGERLENCLRLTREWQLYVVMSRSLRKSFVSVKGIYYQAEVFGETITWVTPHKFAQNLPKEVDFKVMSTFIEFYESLMGFVLYKLYHTMGMKYPPALDSSADASGAHLDALKAESLPKEPSYGEEESADEMEVESEQPKVEKAKAVAKKRSKETKQQVESKSRISTLQTKLKDIVETDDKEAEQEDEVEENDEETEKEVFAEDEHARQIEEKAKEIRAQTSLFKDLVFFISREVPQEPLEFVIGAFGGKTLCESTGASSKDSRINFYVTDRPKVDMSNQTREYVQPQWVFDSSNFRLRMPVKRYAPGADLPPHLSPFVNDEAVGYKPEFAEEVMKMQSAAGLTPEEMELPELRRNRYQKPDTGSDEEVEKNSADEESDDDEEEEANQILDNLLGKNKRKRDDTPRKHTKPVEEEMEESSAEEEDEESSEEEEKTEKEIPTPVKTKKKNAEVEEKSLKKKKTKKEQDETEQVDEEPKPKKQKKKEASSSASFIPSKSFVGAKPGYFFRSDVRGVGYYADTLPTRVVTFKRGAVLSNRQKREMAKNEEKERSKLLMTGKARRLYGKMQHGIKRKQNEAQKLKNRRKSNA
mmetsp:Transcript_488/g.695  ORF Transcript_488/g.695 Transcript_488/m.695 type:complete len:767 (-) Transcript_488:55-2355(-)